MARRISFSTQQLTLMEDRAATSTCIRRYFVCSSDVCHKRPGGKPHLPLLASLSSGRPWNQCHDAERQCRCQCTTSAIAPSTHQCHQWTTSVLEIRRFPCRRSTNDEVDNLIPDSTALLTDSTMSSTSFIGNFDHMGAYVAAPARRFPLFTSTIPTTRGMEKSTLCSTR